MLKQIAFPFVLLFLALSGCMFYSFTGATIPAHLNTIAIPLVEDNSINPIATLDQSMTDMLTERFVRQTRLGLETDEAQADALLTVQIDRYVNAPTSVSGNERATRNRVTVSVQVHYQDQKENKVLLQQTFSSFADYDPVEDGFEGEEKAALIALENIANDIFTAATSNW